MEKGLHLAIEITFKCSLNSMRLSLAQNCLWHPQRRLHNKVVLASTPRAPILDLTWSSLTESVLLKKLLIKEMKFLRMTLAIWVIDNKLSISIILEYH